MRSEISDKLDALAVSVQEMKDVGRLLKLTNKTCSKRSTEDPAKRYFFEDVVQGLCMQCLIVVTGVAVCVFV